jgi:hypothetical protein
MLLRRQLQGFVRCRLSQEREAASWHATNVNLKDLFMGFRIDLRVPLSSANQAKHRAS